MPDVLLIFNPAADRGRSGQKASDLRAIVEKMGGARWAGTEYPGHAAELAENAAKEGVDSVVALGGDGTAHEVINGLMRVPEAQRPALGVVPIGSGNDFAYASGINMNPQLAMERVFQGKPAPVDIGLIADGDGRSEYWDNSVGMLFDAAVNIQSRRITRIHGFAMYLTATVRSIIENYDPTHLKMTIDGAEVERDLLMFTLGNGPREGGGFMTTPEAKNDDGVLDYLMITPISRPMMFRLLPEVMKAAHARFGCVTLGRFRTLTLEAGRAVPVHLDGELWAPYEVDVRKLTVSIVPGAVRLIR